MFNSKDAPVQIAVCPDGALTVEKQEYFFKNGSLCHLCSPINIFIAALSPPPPHATL